MCFIGKTEGLRVYERLTGDKIAEIKRGKRILRLLLWNTENRRKSHTEGRTEMGTEWMQVR